MIDPPEPTKPIDDLAAVLLPDGSWHNVEPGSLSIGPLTITGANGSSIVARYDRALTFVDSADGATVVIAFASLAGFRSIPGATAKGGGNG